MAREPWLVGWQEFENTMSRRTLTILVMWRHWIKWPDRCKVAQAVRFWLSIIDASRQGTHNLHRFPQSQQTCLASTWRWSQQITTKSLTVQKYWRWRKSRVQRKILGSKRDEVTGERRRLPQEKIYGMYSSPNIMQVIIHSFSVLSDDRSKVSSQNDSST